MVITGLKSTSPERVTLIFDDGSELRTSLAVVTDRRLHAGLSLEDADYAALCAASSLSLCRARAMRLINTRPMSRRELIKKLTEKGELPENAESCADWLVEMRLINDEIYAGALVRHYSAKGYGASRVRQELGRHGIPRELWDAAMSEMPEQNDKLERFLRARLTDPDDRVQIKKVSDALFRRGYTWEQIRRAINSFNSQEDEK